MASPQLDVAMAPAAVDLVPEDANSAAKPKTSSSSASVDCDCSSTSSRAASDRSGTTSRSTPNTFEHQLGSCWSASSRSKYADPIWPSAAGATFDSDLVSQDFAGTSPSSSGLTALRGCIFDRRALAESWF